MDTTSLISLVTLLLSVSLFAQRITEATKAFVPYASWPDAWKPRAIHVMTLGYSYLGVLLLSPVDYELLPGAGHQSTVAVITVMSSLGSSFWHSLLKVLTEYASSPKAKAEE